MCINHRFATGWVYQDVVHHVLRPGLFKPNTTKYNEQEPEVLPGDDSKPIFVFEDGEVLGHAFCMITEVKDDKLLQDIKTLYIDDICVDGFLSCLSCTEPLFTGGARWLSFTLSCT